MKFIFYLVFLFHFFNATAQTITTIAGGALLDGGDGGPATKAVLNNPYGIAIDPSGNIYFADRNNHRIRKINSAGIITTIAGTGKAGYSGDGRPASRASINYPIGVASDGNGNLLFSDRYNNCVRKIDLSGKGIITTIAGTGQPGYSGEGGLAEDAQLNGPAGILVGQNGNIFICDAYNNCIRKINEAGIITTFSGTATKGYYGEGRMAMEAELYEPYGIAADSAGNIYFTEYGNERVRKINASGIITTIAGTGIPGYSGDGSQATLAGLNHPTGIAIDKNGNIIIADGDNNCIRKINTAGIISTIAGTGEPGFSGDNGPAAIAALSGPAGVALDGNDNIYFSDLGNNRIRMITQAPGLTIAPDSSLNIVVSANPSEMTLLFEFKSAGEVNIKLMDINGRLLDIQSVRNKSNATFNIKGYAPGLYLYEVVLNGKKETGKFRVE